MVWVNISQKYFCHFILITFLYMVSKCQSTNNECKWYEYFSIVFRSEFVYRSSYLSVSESGYSISVTYPNPDIQSEIFYTYTGWVSISATFHTRGKNNYPYSYPYISVPIWSVFIPSENQHFAYPRITCHNHVRIMLFS